MKKVFAVICSVCITLLSFCLAACDNRYAIPENRCIVGLHKDYQLYSESENEFCVPIDKEIKGIEKKDNKNYYSVIKNADYTIVVNNFVDTNDSWGWPSKDDFFMNQSYWQGEIITQFEKDYGENSDLEDEVFYTTNYGQANDNVPVTFDKNCTVEAIKEPYLNVGGIYEIVEKGKPLESYEDVPLTEDGTVDEKEGVYYLLLKDEVCVHQNAYKTNLEITDYKYEFEKNGWGGNSTKAHFVAKSLNVAEDEELWLYQVCRTYNGKHFVYPLVYVGTTGFAMPIREHELMLDFENGIFNR